MKAANLNGLAAFAVSGTASSRRSVITLGQLWVNGPWGTLTAMNTTTHSGAPSPARAGHGKPLRPAPAATETVAVKPPPDAKPALPDFDGEDARDLFFGC
jgi:hypothetical protein